MNSNEEILKESKDLTLDVETDEDELKRLNINNTNNNKNKKEINNINNNKKNELPLIYNDKKIICIILIVILISGIVFFILLKFLKIPKMNKIQFKKIIDFDDNDNNNYKNKYSNLIINKKSNNINEALGRKLKIAFVYSTLYANGIARFISVAADYFIKTGKYEVYIITEKKANKEYIYDERIIRIIEANRTLLQNKTKDLNIDFFILQNVSGKGTINFYKSLGKFVVGMFHGLYVSAWFHGKVDSYRHWNNFDYLDAFIFIGYDDYFFYKKLGFKNEIFIPNFYTFEPNNSITSNLTGHNIVMLGRAADKIKGIIYAIKTMSFIVKEVPDAKLILLSSSSNIQNLKDYAKELGVYNSIIFNYYTENITKVFWDSSVLMYTSLSEAFPLAMVEAKAHGLPVAAFDVACSPPYQKGVIGVDMLDCEGLANETVKLLKDYEYRKRMGKESKLSLNKFNNVETEKLWEKLFLSLMKGDKYFRKYQKEIEDKYYDENKARERLAKRFRDLLRLNKNFTCHTLDDFTKLEYVRNIKMCPFNDTQIKDEQK